MDSEQQEYILDILTAKGIEAEERIMHVLDDAEDIETRLQFVIDALNESNQLADHCFTFPDGLTWWATGFEPRPTPIK